ncbi:hypothetical protein Misp01_47120 [Microtetraspora sp. NBRC 13810]|nr:hypothetical protein Misp01_47120 [Microtetraspora sp. NBRC 13810]
MSHNCGNGRPARASVVASSCHSDPRPIPHTPATSATPTGTTTASRAAHPTPGFPTPEDGSPDAPALVPGNNFPDAPGGDSSRFPFPAPGDGFPPARPGDGTSFSPRSVAPGADRAMCESMDSH